MGEDVDDPNWMVMVGVVTPLDAIGRISNLEKPYTITNLSSLPPPPSLRLCGSVPEPPSRPAPP
ncbi:hypothetical protein CRG98_033789 [Punica granatum]|uniref:Uncharacterized protein n=1 Tax=Punica granatum TaxID=22663 RepID=A0A2I0IP51_PUNGR|nr:hypothetical protein CRG98_033789 [Punica granatum]